MKPFQETLEDFVQSKVIEPSSLVTWRKSLKAQGKTLATLNGSFDLLHAGHLYILFEASKVADVLLVALNSDRSIQQYKSPNRPIVTLKYRLEMMAAISFIDAITWFDETDPRALLEILKPDVHVNGAEYGVECIEAETVRKNGGRIHLVPRIPGLATSTLLERIQKL